MFKKSQPFGLFCLIAIALLLSGYQYQSGGNGSFKMPYKKAGLSERQAAAHLLSRFTFGATPKDIDEVVNTGLENWFLQQLEGKLDDFSVNERLKEYDALQLANAEVVKQFPRGGKVVKEAVAAGVIHRDSADGANRSAYKEKLAQYMKSHGYRPEQELVRQFVSQKILRAAYGKNQLHEVLTDFWFNHFNISATKNNCIAFIPAYERDVIRPNVTGKFAGLLLATAQSPAMLFYLDNFSSFGTNEVAEQRRLRLQKVVATGNLEGKDTALLKVVKPKKKNYSGLNENYAREVMELHTMGVDGGYTQQDVTQAARIFTGWTVYPMDENGLYKEIKKRIDEAGEEQMLKNGFVRNKDFFFAMNRHDNMEKTVLTKFFPAGGGYQEGVELINLLAHHPATAKFICNKLATRFVNDRPAASLVEKMALTFTKEDGDIKAVLKTMVSAPEFWQKDAIREKTKSPFELTMSAVRALNADITSPIMLNQWIIKMGQKVYFYQAPTGFPDRAAYWINTGSLLSRMNFGLALASQKIPGLTFNLAALNDYHEPESAEAALTIYSKLIMPERDIQATIKRLTPLINDPEIQQKLRRASEKNANVSNMSLMNAGGNGDTMIESADLPMRKANEKKIAREMLRKNDKGADKPMMENPGTNTMLAQVVGIILGSPEFQRR